MNMVINVYEYEREGKCVYMFRHTYALAGIKEMKMKMEKGVQAYSQVYAYIFLSFVHQ